MLVLWPVIGCLLITSGQAWRLDGPDSPKQEGLWSVTPTY